MGQGRTGREQEVGGPWETGGGRIDRTLEVGREGIGHGDGGRAGAVGENIWIINKTQLCDNQPGGHAKIKQGKRINGNVCYLAFLMLSGIGAISRLLSHSGSGVSSYLLEHMQ